MMALTEYTILDTYSKCSHAFIRGCGKDTMRHWVCHAIGEWHNEKDIRRVINKMVDDGIFIRYRSNTNHSCFRLNSYEYVKSSVIIDNESMRRFGTCKGLEQQDDWLHKQFFCQSWNENSNTIYVTRIEYRDVSTDGEMSLEYANKLYYYKRIIRIDSVYKRGNK